jgi:hypothetical protein
VYMCDSLMDCKDIFLSHFMKDFIDLQNDRIINVRMALADAIVSYSKRNQNGNILYEISELKAMLRHMKRDVRDVSEILIDINLGDEAPDAKESDETSATQ